MITIINGANSKTTDVLLEGDADNNNNANITDFSILASAFASVEGQPGYDARADFNASGAVTIAHFSLLASNFTQVGE